MLEVFSPFVISLVDNVLVKTAPDPNQPLFRFIHAMDVCMVNTFMNDRSCLIVIAVRKSKIQQNKVWFISKQQFDNSTIAMCRCTVLLKRVQVALI